MGLSSMEQLERMLSEILDFAVGYLELIEWEEVDKIFNHWFNEVPIVTDRDRVGRLLWAIFR